MKHQDILGIAIPAYKRIDTLEKLLASIHADFPVTVSDNGGNLPPDFMKRHANVHFISDSEVPVLRNWNRVAEAQTSEWIVMPGDDDLYYPHSFATIERTIRENPSADIIFFGHHIIDEHDCVKETWQPAFQSLTAPAGFDKIRLGTPARPPSIVFRRSLYQRLGGFSEAFKVTASDNDFYQRASLIGHTLFVPEVVSGYRVWQSGSTRSAITSTQWLQEIDLWCERVKNFSATSTSYRYTDALHDEIYLVNLRAGIKALKDQGQWVSAWRHFRSSRYPYRAKPFSQAKLIAQLILPAK